MSLWPDTLGFDRFTLSYLAVFLTHAHADHMVGLKQPRASYPWTIYCSKETQRLAVAQYPHLSEARFSVLPWCQWCPIDLGPSLGSTAKQEPWQAVLLPSHHCHGSAMVGLRAPGDAFTVLYTGDVGNTLAPLQHWRRAWTLYADPQEPTSSSGEGVSKAPLPTPVGLLPRPHVYFDDTYARLPVSRRLLTQEETRWVVARVMRRYPDLRLHWSQVGLEQAWPLGGGDRRLPAGRGWSERQRRLARVCAPRGVDLVALGQATSSTAKVNKLTGTHTTRRTRRKTKKTAANPTKVDSRPILVLTCHTAACPDLRESKPVPSSGAKVLSVPYCMHPSRRTLREWERQLRPASWTPLGFAVHPATCD